MKHCIGGRWRERLAAAAVVLAVWKTLTLVYPPLVVPTISGVAERLAAILGGSESWSAIGLTGGRLALGLAIGVAAGILAGGVLGHAPALGRVCRPIMGLVQATPPVSWLILALLWFGFNGRPSVFIVALSSLPVMAVNLMEGVAAIDPRLLEMGAVFRFGLGKRLRYIEIPSVLPYFRAGLRVVVGNGCKAVVLGEVLTTNSGIGGAISMARLAIEPEGVAAWTLIVVLFYYALDFLVAAIPAPGGATANADR